MNEPYDVFLSFKGLGSNGKPTRDSVLAHDIYEYLTARTLRVFYSSISLETLGVSAFKKAIDQALDRSRVLVAIGTSGENLDSEWVRYEWDSFYNDILTGVKVEGRVFVYIEDVGLASLPRALRQSQAINHKAGSLELLYNFIANAFRFEPVQSRPQKSPSHPLDRRPALEEILQELDSLSAMLASLQPSAKNIGAVGQALLQCSSFLLERGVNDDAAEALVEELMQELDSDEREEKRRLGGTAPVISVGKVRQLMNRLKEIRRQLLSPKKRHNKRLQPTKARRSGGKGESGRARLRG
jgi:hypothetical protein